MSARRLALALAAAALVAGCITTPLDRREWHATETVHYEIRSALGADETEQLALDLERFRAAATFVWGDTIPAGPRRTRVYAFDDRAIGRPFALHSQRAYLLERQRGDTIVLRTGGGWRGDARTELKLAVARRLFWNAAPLAGLPPWYEEGLAQLASTIEVRDGGAIVGGLRSDHLAQLRSEHWVPFERLFAARHVAGWSRLERERLESESWALCHYLKLAAERRRDANASLRRFRRALAAGAEPAAAAREALGSELQPDVWRYVNAPELPSLALQIPKTGAPIALRPIAPSELATELGALALAIGETDRARRHLESALALEPDAAHAHAALAGALAAEEPEEAEAHLARALALAPDDALVRLAAGQRLRQRAGATADAAERARLADAARGHYRRAATLDPELVEAHAGLAATHLVKGEDPDAGRAAAREALRRLPGDAAARHLVAELALASGDRGVAQREATLLASRARSRDEREAAAGLLERVDAQRSR